MAVPLFNLHRVLQKHTTELEFAFKNCLEAARFINGPQVQALEQQLSQYLGTSETIGVSSGTDALLAIFMSLQAQPGDEIIVTPFTFIASASSILRAGFKPVFADLAPNSFHPYLEQIDAVRTHKTKGILAVHLFGEPNNLTEMRQYCEANKLWLIEDCAQSLGSAHAGQKVGSFGHASAFSFFPAKNLGCLGDGGAVATNSNDLAEKIKIIKSHGSKTKYHCEVVGGNFRLDTIQAAMLNVLLPQLDGWILKRQQNAAIYSAELGGLPGLKLPKPVEGHSWNQFTLRTQFRDKLKKELDQNGIGNAIYYPKPLHEQPVFGSRVKLKEAELRCEEVISIPIYPGLLNAEQEIIIDTIKHFFRSNT